MVNSIQGISSAVFQMFDDMNSGINNKGSDTGQGKINDPDGSNNLKNKNDEGKPLDEKSAKADFSSYEKQIRSLMGENHIYIEFSLDKDTKKMIMKVMDNDTHEVIRQYPPEVSLKIARILNDTMDLGHVANFRV